MKFSWLHKDYIGIKGNPNPLFLDWGFKVYGLRVWTSSFVFRRLGLYNSKSQ